MEAGCLSALTPSGQVGHWNVVMPRAFAWVPGNLVLCWHPRSCCQNGKGKIGIFCLRWSLESFLPPWCGDTLVLEEAYPKMPVPVLPTLEAAGNTLKALKNREQSREKFMCIWRAYFSKPLKIRTHDLGAGSFCFRKSRLIFLTNQPPQTPRMQEKNTT